MLKSSAVLIQEMLARFADDYAKKFPDAARISQRKVSAWLTPNNPNLLSRWVNEKSHGAHSEWRIPLFRVQQLCDVLEASEEERMTLMCTRIEEAIAFDKCQDAAALVNWLTPILDEALSRPVLSSQEAQLVEAFRAAQRKNPVGQHLPLYSELGEELEATLSSWITKAVAADVEQTLAENALEEGVAAPRMDADLVMKIQRYLAQSRAAVPQSAKTLGKAKTGQGRLQLSILMRRRAAAQKTLEAPAADSS